MTRDRAARLALVLFLVNTSRACWCHGVLILHDEVRRGQLRARHLASFPTRWSK